MGRTGRARQAVVQYKKSIRKRSGFLPIHAGALPRPDQVWPVFGLRYLGRGAALESLTKLLNES
uniref:Uncharacterized protein n=1 Tax=Cupriavidus taiwanensis TaxID=164546 RepID=A0A375HDM6_9BURK|nr:protein of unknown function [Cupriavidus taiwanensis]